MSATPCLNCLHYGCEHICKDCDGEMYSAKTPRLDAQQAAYAAEVERHVNENTDLGMQVYKLKAEVERLKAERDALALICAETIKNIGVVNDDDPAHLPNHAADVAANDKAGWKEAKSESEAHDKTREGYLAMRAEWDAAVRERDAAVEALKEALAGVVPHDRVSSDAIKKIRVTLAKIEGGRG